MFIIYSFAATLTYGHSMDIYELLSTLSTSAFYTFRANYPWKVLR